MVHALDADASLARRFLELAAAQAGEAGIFLKRRHDMATLAAVNRANRDSWPPLIPMFDTAHSVLTPETALWVDASNERGETVGTYAARFFWWPHATLAEEARALRIFYADPAPHLARGEFIDLPDNFSNSMITGRTAATGALWIRPDYRRLGLTKILSRACKAYAFELWEPSVFWALINPAHLDSGVARAWGSISVSRGGRIHAGGQDLPLAISFQSRQRFLEGIAKDTRHGAIDSSRLIVTALTNTSDAAARQGMTSRS
jgi:GNAT superfamily N-acetyltransferase